MSIDTAVVDEVLSTYQYRECRGGLNGHRWVLVNPKLKWTVEVEASRGPTRWRQALCTECQTKRIDRRTIGGDRLDSRYVYPEGYRLDEEHRVSRDDIDRAEIRESDRELAAAEARRAKRKPTTKAGVTRKPSTVRGRVVTFTEPTPQRAKVRRTSVPR